MKKEKQKVTTNKQSAILWKLFISTLYLSAFTFGGGYVIVTLMRSKVVQEYGWIEEEEMLDLIAIAQSAPGAIAVNGAIVIGYKLKGMLGVLVSVLAAILPPMVIISIISVFYSIFSETWFIATMLEGMQAGVAAVIGLVVFQMGRGMFKEKNILHILIATLAFIANYFLKVNVAYIIISCILLGIIGQFFPKKNNQQGGDKQ